MKCTSMLVAAFVAFAACPVLAWENTKAHPAINRRAFDHFLAAVATGAKYQHGAMDRAVVLSGPAVTASGKFNITTGSASGTIGLWLAHAGYSADEPEVIMSLRHFFDPLAKQQYYLTDIIGDTALTNPAIDARTWALEGPASGAYPENEFSWNKGLRYYRLAMERDSDREENLARAFRSLGETMHLLADMTQPAHVRNDGHPYSEPIEDAISTAIIDGVDIAAAPNVTLAVPVPELLFLNVATYTNANYYSNDTIADAAGGVLPNNGKPAYDKPRFSDFTYLNGVVSRGSDRMLEQTLSGYVFGTNAATPFHIPMAFAPDYARQLIPLAVQANARLIDLFLPDLSLTLTVAPGASAATLGGELAHKTDSVWKAPIRYTGPGSLYKRGGLWVADVSFSGGVLASQTVALVEGEVVYLEVKAGGRILRSPEVTVKAKEPESLLARWQTSTGATFEFTGRLIFEDGEVQSTDPPGLTFAYMKLLGNGITWSGASFAARKVTRTGPMSMPGDREYTLVETHILDGTLSADGRTLSTVRAENTKVGTSVYLDGHSEESKSSAILEGRDLPLSNEFAGQFSVSTNVRANVVHVEQVDSILKRSSINSAQWEGAALIFSFQ